MKKLATAFRKSTYCPETRGKKGTSRGSRKLSTEHLKVGEATTLQNLPLLSVNLSPPLFLNAGGRQLYKVVKDS